ncbi:hypothetical protein VNO78_00069 [Psophocarpus tetragonolobus]|uniref:Uncharacterized protein n=1 Tax=Psophocarpus tetragonolobus TaxID=3891 RepID=A0AAN9XUR6_PSOTE
MVDLAANDSPLEGCLTSMRHRLRAQQRLISKILGSSSEDTTELDETMVEMQAQNGSFTDLVVKDSGYCLRRDYFYELNFLVGSKDETKIQKAPLSWLLVSEHASMGSETSLDCLSTDNPGQNLCKPGARRDRAPKGAKEEHIWVQRGSQRATQSLENFPNSREEQGSFSTMRVSIKLGGGWWQEECEN